jgi:hypothetical protein
VRKRGKIGWLSKVLIAKTKPFPVRPEPVEGFFKTSTSSVRTEIFLSLNE